MCGTIFKNIILYFKKFGIHENTRKLIANFIYAGHGNNKILVKVLMFTSACKCFTQSVRFKLLARWRSESEIRLHCSYAGFALLWI